jgi:hypothetical protein
MSSGGRNPAWGGFNVRAEDWIYLRSKGKSKGLDAKFAKFKSEISRSRARACLLKFGVSHSCVMKPRMNGKPGFGAWVDEEWETARQDDSFEVIRFCGGSVACENNLR